MSVNVIPKPEDILWPVTERTIEAINFNFDLLFRDVGEISTDLVTVDRGGTGQTSFGVGDILYARDTDDVRGLADIAVGNVLLSGGVGVAPSYGKVGLTTHISGILPLANGGTSADLSATGGASQVLKQVGAGSVVTVGRLTDNDILMNRIAGSTLSDLASWFDAYSSGVISGGTIADAGGGNITVTAGYGLIKATNAAFGVLYFCDWANLTATAIPVNTARWIGVEYNAGAPQITVRASDNFTYLDDFPLGYVVNEAGTLHVTNNARVIVDAPGGLIRRFHQTLPYVRDELVGGLILNETGVRKITLSGGYLWDRSNRFAIAAIDTSGAGRFDLYYRDGAGGFTRVAAQTDWPNEQYDDNSGVLATMTNNRYAVIWWYLELDGGLVALYGRAQHVTAAAAQAESVPATLPLRLQVDGKLIGRLIFKKSDATATAIDTTWLTQFSPTATTTHNNLAGLQGGTLSEYYHLTAAEYAALGGGGSPLTTKGDLYTFTAVNARLPVGTNGQLLSADSGEATGLKWIAAPASSPLTTKGDLYTYSTLNDRLAVGANGTILTARPAEATGLAWEVPTTQTSTLLNATVHTDTKTDAPQVGDLVVATAITGSVGAQQFWADGASDGEIPIVSAAEAGQPFWRDGEASGGLTGGGTVFWQRLAMGSVGQVLSVTASGVAWGTQDSETLRCRIYRTASTTIATATPTAVTFDAEDSDPDQMHSTVTDNTRVTIPTGGAGVYLIIGQASYLAAVGGRRAAWLYKNGSRAAIAEGYTDTAGGAPLGFTLQVSALLDLIVGDYIEVYARQDSGGDDSLLGGAPDLSSLQMILLKKA
jgi:hypothetical protein